MHKELTLHERLKIAKHFHAGFELEPNDVQWVSLALDRLRTNNIERCDAENLYIMKEMQFRQRRVYALIVAANICVLTIMAGAFFWLM